MKTKSILITVALALSALCMNAQPRALGARIGATGFDVSYQHTLGKKNFIQTDLSLDFGYAASSAPGIKGTAIYNFVSNFQTAFNPQLVQTYSANNLAEHRILISRASRLSFILIFLIVLPLCININYFLHLWLKDVPQYTESITLLILVFSIFEAIGTPLWMSMQAIGDIKTYQIIISAINLLLLLISIAALKFGANIEIIFSIKLIIGIIIYFFRLVHILPKINYHLSSYVKDVLLPIIAISLFSTTLSLLVHFNILDENVNFIFTSLTSICVSVMLFYIIGITKHERHVINTIITKYLFYNKPK